MGRLLERFKGISPLSRDFYGGKAGEQYRRQEEAYGRALRILRRQARRGDADSALAEIKVRDEAMNKGYTPGGIRDADARVAQSRGFAASLEASAKAREQAAGVAEQNNREGLEDLNAPEDRGDARNLGAPAQPGRASLLGGAPSASGLRTGGLSDAPRRLGEPAQPSRAGVMDPAAAEDEDDELESILGSRRRLGDADTTDTRRLLQTTTRLGSRGFRSAY